MLTFRDLVTAFRKLEIDRSTPVIVHSSLRAFGQVHGGAETVLGALLGAFQTVVVPVFTYKTMVVPEAGPADNAMRYGSSKDANRLAEFFQPDMPADLLMGVVPETLRRRPGSMRSSHPILSFAGINAGPFLEAQTTAEPLAPIRLLTEAGGWVLLLGVDYTVNTSIHYGERQAGRHQFTRWALTPSGMVECPGFPGCSNGFNALAPSLEERTRQVPAGNGLIQAVPLKELVETVCDTVREDPRALLCSNPTCERCNAVRALADPTG